MTLQEKQELISALKTTLNYFEKNELHHHGICYLLYYLRFNEKMSFHKSMVFAKYIKKCSLKRKISLNEYWWPVCDRKSRIKWLKATIERLEKQLNETT